MLRRLSVYLAATAIVIGRSLNADGAVLTGPVIYPTNGHAYYLLNEASWTASQAEAVSLGGNLATINDASEQAWVFDTFSQVQGKSRSLWIGLNDANAPGSFEWVSGEPVTYTNWLPSQPDNSLVFGGESYVHMMRSDNGFGHPSGKWNDMDNLDSFAELRPTAGVVEVVPEPDQTVVLGAIATLFAAIARRRKSTERHWVRSIF